MLCKHPNHGTATKTTYTMNIVKVADLLPTGMQMYIVIDVYSRCLVLEWIRYTGVYWPTFGGSVSAQCSKYKTMKALKCILGILNHLLYCLKLCMLRQPQTNLISRVHVTIVTTRMVTCY